MNDSRVGRAALNNAEWCDAVCRAHGNRTEFRAGAWVNLSRPPRFYPNVVMLPGAGSTHRQIAQLVEEIDVTAAPRWAIKDSAASMDLEPLGFDLLFEASWIWRTPEDHSRSSADWSQIRSESDLCDWERAWGGDDSTVFLPGLLGNPTVAVLAGRQEGRIVRGCVANRTGDVVGVSNVFGPAHDLRHTWCELVGAVGESFPGAHVTGYERGEDLEAAVDEGFEVLGPLRVWTRREK